MKQKQKPTIKQIVAMGAIVILVAMYLITLILAIADSSASGRWFQFSLLLTIAVPILAWIFIYIYGVYAKKHTIADLDILQNADLEEQETPEQEEKSGSES